MAERLALALSQNKVASELRAGLAAAIERERRDGHMLGPDGQRSKSIPSAALPESLGEEP